MLDIVIDAEFQQLIPPHSDESYNVLESDILTNGCRDALLVWQETNILLDGHTRYSICTKNNILFTVKYEPLTDRLAAKIRILNIQLVRRNLAAIDRIALASTLRETLEAEAKNRQISNLKNGNESPVKAMLPERGPQVRDVIANVAGVGARTVDAVRALEKANILTPELKQSIREGETSIHAEYKKLKQSINRAEKIEEVVEAAKGNKELDISVKYPVIYCDPPWSYEGDFFEKGVKFLYPTMSQDELKALPINELSTTDAIMFMWATCSKLGDAIELIKHWGFEYKICAVWDKQLLGMGKTFRGQVELLLVGKKGNLPPPVAENRPRDLYSEARSEHSKKPEYYYTMIEKMYPELPKIELFARNQRDGWVSWGNQSNA